ncbi:Ger(x)C family spore germination protein [Clostridium sp. P21]|uniref:Ger(X)C family spore germination protein n=1 Tax=Clostridium muellerianum TaxID=2716538 RepID=A0A7Y0EEF3_9CLOT|nr:Ger(x)C family spore germination protein [Clostridium muellerianum]NMM61991.1 Ger(x)C family spore germination protein [Clostridium muellerianum]
MIKRVKNAIKNIIIKISIVMIFLWSFIGTKGQLIEDLAVPVGIGYDLEKRNKGDVYYSIPIATYISDPSGEIKSEVITGRAKNIGETRGKRQLRSEKKFLLGLEKVLIISESYAQYGINNILDILLNSPQVNDRAVMVVCKGKAEDILNYKIKGYSNAADYIESLIINSKYYNFFSGEYNFINSITRVDAEGRNLVLPYIELKENLPEVTGIAIFKGDTMIGKLDLQQAKIVNLIRKDSGGGIFTIKKGSKRYIDYETKVKRKVKCYKQGEKYKFIIDLNLNGTVASNELYENFNKDPKVQKEFVKDMEESIKKTCEDFINSTKSQYKVDFLSLGKYAAAKYGRHTGVDWNKVVSESDIYVNVKVKVNAEGRGEY